MLNLPRFEAADPLTDGSAKKGILLYAIPVAITLFLQLLYTAVDTIIVSHFGGERALAVIGLSNPITSLFTNLFSALSVGATIATALNLGAKDSDQTSRASQTAVTLGIVSGIAFGVIGMITAKPLLSMSGCPEDMINDAALYMGLYYLSMPATALFFFGAAIMRACGNTQTPLHILLASSIIHVLLMLLFVRFMQLSYLGAALSTVLSQTLAAGMMLYSSARTAGPCRISLKKIGIDLKQLKTIVLTGVPAAIQSILMSTSNMVIQTAINSFGVEVIAGAAAANSVLNMIVNPVMDGVVQATVVFVGQNYGAGKFHRIRQINRDALYVVFMLTLPLGVLTTLFSKFLLKMYTSGEVAIATGHIRVAIECLTYFLCGFQGVVCATMRGINRSVYPLISTALGTCLFRMLWIRTIFAFFPTLTMLYLCYPVSWIATYLFQQIVLIRQLEALKRQRND